MTDYIISWRKIESEYEARDIVSAKNAQDALFIFEFNDKGNYPRKRAVRIEIAPYEKGKQ